MSWQDKQKTEAKLTTAEQVELMAQDMDTLMLNNEAYKDRLDDDMNALEDALKQTNASLADFATTRDTELRWLSEQKTAITTLQKELEHTLQEREKKTVLIKKWLELAFYGVLAIMLYQALTTSLWQTIGFKTLYSQVGQYRYGHLVVTGVYIGLNLLALGWLGNKLSKRRY